MPTILRRPTLLRQVASVLVATLALGAVAAPVAAATETVRITDRLSAAELTIPAGTTVRWVNRDDDRHRMRSQSGPDRFDSGNLEPGDAFSVRLTAAGTYRYLDERDDENRRYFGTIVVHAADGSGGRSAGTGSSGGSSGTGSAGETGGARTSAEVGMAGRSFRPGSVTIAAGGTVTFRNDDDREHTVTSAGGSFDSGIIGEGGTWQRTFEEAGTFPFLCALHPDMTGEVVVAAASAPGGAGAAEPAPTPTPTPSGTPPPTPASTPSPGASPATDAAAPTVEMRDFVFDSPELTVPAGTTVTWRNTGEAPHTATAADGAFDSGMVAAGATWERTFGEAGTFAYVCAFHPEMTATITVVEAAAAPRAAGPRGDGTGDVTTHGAPAPQSPTGAESAAARAPLPDAEALLRVGLVVLLVGAAVVLFMRTIAGSARRPA